VSSRDTEAAVQGWAAFCDGIKTSGTALLRAGSEADAVSQAEGPRYLTRLLRSGIEKFVEYWDPLDPYMAVTYNERLKWGMDNPDSVYAISCVDGNHEYELSGNRGTVPMFNLTSAKMGTNARQVTTGFLDGGAFKTDQHGNFTIHIGGPARADNWLKLESESNSVLLRQTFSNPGTEKAVSCRIRLLSPVVVSPSLTIEQALERLEKAQGFFTNTGRTFLGLAELMARLENTLPPVSQQLMDTMGGDPNYAYYWASFRLSAGEALLIHFPEVPESEYWGLCLYDYWLESLDYTKALTNLNSFNASLNPDGSLTIVVSERRPGGGNWLNTLGHSRGNMMMRWNKRKTAVDPQTEVVNLAAVDWASKLKRWPNAWMATRQTAHNSP
jgi:hypothetical protein